MNCKPAVLYKHMGKAYQVPLLIYHFIPKRNNALLTSPTCLTPHRRTVYFHRCFCIPGAPHGRGQGTGAMGREQGQWVGGSGPEQGAVALSREQGPWAGRGAVGREQCPWVGSSVPEQGAVPAAAPGRRVEPHRPSPRSSRGVRGLGATRARGSAAACGPPWPGR